MMRDITDYHLGVLIARKEPLIDHAEFVSAAAFILSFPVLAVGLMGTFFGWIGFKIVSGVYVFMTVAGVVGNLGAREVRRRAFLRRAQEFGTELEDAKAFWKNYDWGQNDARN